MWNSPGYGYGYDGMMGGSWLGGILMLAFGALVIASIVVAIIWAVRSASGHGSATGAPPAPPAGVQHDQAVAIARERFAKGEIDKGQFDELMRALGM